MLKRDLRQLASIYSVYFSRLQPSRLGIAARGKFENVSHKSLAAAELHLEFWLRKGKIKFRGDEVSVGEATLLNIGISIGGGQQGFKGEQKPRPLSFPSPKRNTGCYKEKVN